MISGRIDGAANLDPRHRPGARGDAPECFLKLAVERKLNLAHLQCLRSHVAACT
jgi:hypothetical protein